MSGGLSRRVSVMSESARCFSKQSSKERIAC